MHREKKEIVMQQTGEKAPGRFRFPAHSISVGADLLCILRFGFPDELLYWHVDSSPALDGGLSRAVHVWPLPSERP